VKEEEAGDWRLRAFSYMEKGGLLERRPQGKCGKRGLLAHVWWDASADYQDTEAEEN